MGQTYTANCYDAAHVGHTDLTNMEVNFATLRSTFSGAGAPGVGAVVGMQWFDTAKNRLKIQNNTTYVGVMTGTVSTKIWIYMNAAEDGWAIDSTPADVVLGLKGGNVYLAGATTDKGTFASSGHVLIGAEMPTHEHSGTTDSDAHTHAVQTRSTGNPSGVARAELDGGGSAIAGAALTDSHTHTFDTAGAGAGGSHTHAADANVRPLAAVGTLQYMDI